MITGSAIDVSVAATTMAQEDHGGGGWETLFSVDTGLMIWTVATFLVLLFVLTRFAWKPLLGALEAREQGIQASLDEATRLRDESREMAEKNRAQLAEARREAQAIVAESRDAAERVRRDIEEKARLEGQSLIERARREIDQQKQAAIEELRRESVDLAMGAASKLIRRNLDTAADRELVSSYLSQMGREESPS